MIIVVEFNNAANGDGYDCDCDGSACAMCNCAWLVDNTGTFSPVELFLSSRKPFALPPVHLKKKEKINFRLEPPLSQLWITI